MYGVARTSELASALRKFGFGITKGVEVLESILDVPHEISYSEGKEIRDLTEKMGVEALIHGALDTPVTMGEMELWRRAQDTMERSIRSAIMCGASYVLFHGSVWRWPETLTAAELPVSWTMVDELGRPIRERLKEPEEKELREWFVEKYWRTYAGYILLPEEDRLIEAEILAKTRELEEKLGERLRKGEKEAVEEFTRERGKFYETKIKEVLKEHLEEGKKWLHEDRGNPVDIYRIMAHYLLLKKDPIGEELSKMYRKELEEAGLLPIPTESKKIEEWVGNLLKRSKEAGKKPLADFYYAIVASKYYEGHLKKLLETVENFIKKEVPILEVPPDEKEKLKKIAKEIKITIETPFIGGAYAGMMTLWHPRQIYAAVKSFRKALQTEKIFMTIDFEHTAVEGVDPYKEIPEFTKLAPDAGKFILSLHVTKPTPLHHHLEVEPGDVEIYKLLWNLRKAGMGKYFTVYLIFERGGEAEPYKRSITALKIMVDHLEKNIAPEELIKRPEFFGVTTGEIASEERQLATIREHARDPLKGLITVPEEAYTFLGRAATEKGKRPEEWKKEELR